MTHATCSIEGCQRIRRVRGWCSTHYQRWRVHGDVNVTFAPRSGAFRSLPDVERFRLSYRKVESGCWEWIGSRKSNGYGQIRFAKRNQHAHRVSYELHVGPIPDGLHIDHLCMNKGCVNPAHLEPVAPAVNTRRAADALVTACPQGHPYDSVNTRWRKNGRYRRRYCAECKREVDGRRARSRLGLPDRRTRIPKETVEAIRERYAAGGITQRRLSAEYGISNQHVSRIVNGQRRADGGWRHA